MIRCNIPLLGPFSYNGTIDTPSIQQVGGYGIYLYTVKVWRSFRHSRHVILSRRSWYSKS
jgi:hypothetical protein